jgi:hypothetical protein
MATAHRLVRVLCTPPSHTHGPACSRCGPTGVHLWHRRPSPLFPSTGQPSVVPPAATSTATALTTYMSMGEEVHPRRRCFRGAPYQLSVAPWNPAHGGAWNQDSLVQNFNNMTLTPPAPSEWYADSGAGSHMTADASKISTLSSPTFSTPSSIIVGNGALLPVTAIRSHTFSFPHRNLVLNNVLVSPHIIKNLISIRHFTTDNNCSIEFDPFGLSMKDLETRNVIARCNSSGDLYPFFPPATSTSAFLAAPTSLWHRLLGHLGHEVLSKLISSKSISCNKDDSHHLCHACQLGRHTKLPFGSSNSQATNNFDLIHCDLWTSPIVSVSGYKYYLVILDDCSHYIWTFPLRLKSDTFATLSHFFAYVCTQFGTTIKSVQCDNGREFDNSPACTFFLSNGVALHMSCPYTSQQNGKAERSLRTINNILHSLLFQASLPPVYWVEALHTATYLVNWLPTKTLTSSTPFFHIHTTTPSYEHLKVFGCACYPNMSSTAAHKLAPRSSLCVFLGYSSEHKGYRCLELESNRILTSRHVVFDDSTFPFANMSTSPLTSSALDFLLDDSDLTVPLPGATFARAGTADRAAEAPTPPHSPPNAPPAPPRSPPSAAPRSPQPRAGHGAPSLVGPSTSAAPVAHPLCPRPMLLPLCPLHRSLPAVPRPPGARSSPGRFPSPPSSMSTPCTPVANPALHILWIVSTSTMCQCRHCLAPFGMPLQIQIGAQLCKLNMMPSWLMTPGVWYHVLVASIWLLASGFSSTNFMQMGLLIATRLIGFFGGLHNDLVLIMMRHSARLLSQR